MQKVQYEVYKISSLVFGEIGGALRTIWLVAGNLFCFLDQIGMQKSSQIVRMLFENSFFFLLYDSDSPKFYKSLLLDLSLLLLFGLPVLLKLDLPEFLNLSLVLELLHSFLFTNHLVQPLLLCHSLKHLYSELLLKIFLLQFLFLFHFFLLLGCILKQFSKLFFFPLLLLISFLQLFFIDKLIVLHPYVLKFLQLLSTLFLSSFKFKIYLFLLLLFLFHFLLLNAIPLIQLALILGYFLQLSSVSHFNLYPHLLFGFVLLNHYVIQISLFLLFLLSLSQLLLNQLLNLTIYDAFLFFVFFPSLALQLTSILDLRLQYFLVVFLSFLQLSAFGFSALSLALCGGQHFCLFLGLEGFGLQISDLLFCYLFGPFFGHIRNINFLPHGVYLWVGGDDGVDHILLELVFEFELANLLCQLLVSQFHVIQIIYSYENLYSFTFLSNSSHLLHEYHCLLEFGM